MFGDVLTRLLSLVFCSATTAVFFCTAASLTNGAELKAFDARYLLAPKGGPNLRKAEQEVFRLTNAFRKQEGREPLKANQQLDKAAVYFAAYMARTDTYGHEADGNHSEDRIAAYKYDACLTAENIAYVMSSTGFSTDELARDFFEMWKNSPEHRANLLDADVKDVGIAIGFAPSSGRYYVVQNFGRPKSSAMRFQVTNQTTDTLHYRVKVTGRGGPPEDEIELPPRATMVHESCRPAKLDWSWTKQDDKIAAENNQQFVISKTEKGYVVVKQPMREP
jgi:uncharacterized protein YkwD